MTGFEVLHLVNIIVIWALALALMYIQGKMKFSLYRCFARWIFHRDKSCFGWLVAHKYYLYCFVVSWLLLYVSLGLLSQLYDGIVRIRQQDTLMATIGVWCFLIPLILTLFFRAYKHEIK